MPGGGQGRVDEVGGSGIYPVSEMEGASDDAVVHGGMSFGQGDRGAAGYEDAGTSEIFYLDEEKDRGKDAEGERGIPKQTVNPDSIEQAESGTPGGDSDFTGGIPNLDQTTDAPVEQNDYNT